MAGALAASGDRRQDPGAHSLRPDKLLPGHRVDLLAGGGEAYPAMLQAISSARESVELETYIWRGDSTGRRFVAALAERARQGVRVRCVVDGAGTYGMDAAIVEPLAEAGARVEVFHPVAPWRARWGWSVRDHRKLLLVDGRVAFAGGLNLGDEYAPREEPWRGGGWRDVSVRVEGPAVAALQDLFESTWSYLVPGPPGRVQRPAAVQRAGGARVQALAVERRGQRKRIQDHYLFAVHGARRSVAIQSAYFIPNRSWRRALIGAARRGCDVRVMVPRNGDVPGIRWASRFTWTRLLRGGVRILEFLPTMLHAKTVLVDGEWAAVGSYNLDHRSLRYNWEVALAIVDPRVCAALASRFEVDARECAEVDPAAWGLRPGFSRLREKLAYLFRAWL